MNDNSIPRHIGGAHASAPIISIEAAYHEGIDQVVVDFVSYDHARVFSVQLDAAAANQLAGQLTAAVDIGLQTP